MFGSSHTSLQVHVAVVEIDWQRVEAQVSTKCDALLMMRLRETTTRMKGGGLCR